MTTTITPATLRDMSYISANMREADRREITAVFPYSSLEIAAAMWAASEDFRWCAHYDGQPVCAFGVSEMLPGLGSGWAFGTASMPRVIRSITAFCRRTASRQAALRFRRIEVRTAIDHPDSHRWLESLGFLREGLAVDYGAGGIDFAVYGATRSSAARLIGDKHERVVS